MKGGNNTEIIEQKCLCCRTPYDVFCYLCKQEANVRTKKAAYETDTDHNEPAEHQK